MTGAPRTLRLLVVVHGYPPAVGGVEFAVRDIAERLAAGGAFSVTVLTTDAYTNENFRDARLPRIPIQPGERQAGVEVRRFRVSTAWAPLLRIAQALAWRLRLPGNDRLRTWYQGPISRDLREAVRTLPADVVLAASFPLNHMRYPFQRRDRAPVVLLPSVHPWDRWGYERPGLLKLTRRAAASVAYTAAERDWLARHGAPADRLRVIPLGVAPGRPVQRGGFRARHGIPGDAFVVAYVGQLGSHKGVDVLISALPALLERAPGTWLVVAGAPTPFSPRLEALAGALPAAARSRVLLLGRVDEDEKSALLEDADVFASPSRHESFGLTVVEAWAHGLPVVVGSGPAQSDLLEAGSLGVLVRYGSEAELVSALAELAGAPERRRRLGAAGRARYLERYTLDRIADAYGDLLREVAERGRP